MLTVMFLLMSTRQHQNPSVEPAAVITFPHFTSLVINGLCQSSGVIGRRSSPVKRLIRMLLCGWLKAMINNVMSFTQDLFCCSMLKVMFSYSNGFCSLYKIIMCFSVSEKDCKIKSIFHIIVSPCLIPCFGIDFPSVLFLWMQYHRNLLRKCELICHKCPFGLQDE